MRKFDVMGGKTEKVLGKESMRFRDVSGGVGSGRWGVGWKV